MYIKYYHSPVGRLVLVSDGTFLKELRFENSPVPDLPERDLDVFGVAAEWLDIYFSGRDPGWLPPMAPERTPFRKLIGDEMLKISFGRVVSYGYLAARAAALTGKERMSAQAAGGAVGHNPVGIIIPCHRVVGSDGSLTGFGGGIDVKIALLRNEGIDPDSIKQYFLQEETYERSI